MNKVIKKTEVQKKMDLEGKHSRLVDFGSESGGVLNKDVMSAKGKAVAIINEAIAEANVIRADAKALLARVEGEMERAKKDGYENGRMAGLSSVTEMASSIEIVREKFYKNAESEIIKLVMMIAEKVIGKMVREHVGAIKSIVHQAVESSLGERITVRLNPEDYKVITSDDVSFKDILDRTKRVVFKEDDSITKGGCIVETEVGTIDARLETQLKAIKKALEL